MINTPNQLTKLPVCPSCRRQQLTNEELVKVGDPKDRRCWFCVVEGLITMGFEGSIPEPAEYGRAPMTKEEGIEIVKQKFFRPTITEAIAEATNADSPASQKRAQDPLLQPTVSAPIRFDETERKEFAIQFGMDPVPKSQIYKITVHGANEETYLQYGCPVAAELGEEREMKRIMSQMLEIFGKLQKFGPQFAATLIDLQSTQTEMFLGRPGK